MKIFMATVGSRGDVQPMLALAVRDDVCGKDGVEMTVEALLKEL